MKLISLNIWGGRIHDPLIEFINQHKDSTDIFCFQEIFRSEKDILTHESHSNIYSELISLLPEFNLFFKSTADHGDTGGFVDFKLEFGQGTFIRKDIQVKNQGDVFIHKNFNELTLYPNGKPNFPRNFLYSVVDTNGKEFLLLNVHGFWAPMRKIDTPERIRQSQIILDFISKYEIPKIVIGDFNLETTTESLKMLNDKMRNLVLESDAKTTRSKYYDKNFREFDKFADYCLVSNDLKVIDFKVMPDEVSDHLPLYLEFEV